MFSQNQLDAYKNIKAPAELYAKIKDAKPRKKPLYLIPIAASLAACLVILFCSVFAQSKAYMPGVLVNGQKLESSVMFYDVSPADIMESRTTPKLQVPIQLNIQEKTEITVTEGLVKFENVQNETITIDKSSTVYWEIEQTSPFPQCKMTLSSASATTVITLTQNETDGSYTATIN